MKKKTENQNNKISLRSIFLISLSLFIFLPIIPLTLATWFGYEEETIRLEDEQKATNRQMALLSEHLLEEILLRAVYILKEPELAELSYRTKPYVHWEEYTTNKGITKSTIDPARIGKAVKNDTIWKSIQKDHKNQFFVSMVEKIPSIKYPTIMVRVPVDSKENDKIWRIAFLDTAYMFEQLTSAFKSMVNRHIYAVDSNGNAVFYSSMDLVLNPNLIKQNPVVLEFLKGNIGHTNYTSTISNNERIGFSHKMKGTDWGIIVSADISSKLIRIQDRFIKVVFAFLLAIFLAMVVFLYFSRKLILPLAKVTKEIRKANLYEYTNLNIPESMRKISEFDELIKDFDIHMKKALKAEKKNAQAEKMAVMGEVAAGLAHEIGTPLNVMRGNAQYLLRKMNKDSSDRESLEKIVYQTGRIATLIRSLLDLARPDDTKPEEFNASEVIEKTLKTVSEMYPSVQIIFEKQDVLPKIKGFPRKMEHVFINLFINSCHAMNGAGALGIMQQVYTEDEVDYIQITISDTGCGIKHEDINSIFKPFFSTKGAGKGTGLGLAIVERVVKEHGGHIRVESEPANGAMFYISLPLDNNDETII